eukprot:108177_1
MSSETDSEFEDAQLIMEKAQNNMELDSGKNVRCQKSVCVYFVIFLLLLNLLVMICGFLWFYLSVDLSTLRSLPIGRVPSPHSPIEPVKRLYDFGIAASQFPNDTIEILYNHDEDSQNVTAQESEILRAIFDLFDADNDNLWNLTDFETFIYFALEPHSNFDVIDMDHNEVISLKEIYLFLKAFDATDIYECHETDLLLQNIFNYDASSDASSDDDDDDDDDDDNTLYNEYIAQLWLYQLDTEKIGVIARDDYIKYIEDEEWQFHNKNDDAHVDFGEFSSLFFDSLYYKSWRHSMQQLADDEDLINGIYEAISDIDASDIAALSLSTEAHEFNAAILSYVNTHVLSDEHDATQSLLYSFPNIYYAKDLIDITSRRRLRKNPHYGSIYGGFGDMKFCFGETGVVDMRTADGDYDKKQLKDVRVGQYVFDGDEYSKVIAVEIGETHMMMLKLSMHHMNDSNQNTDIVLTEDHLIYTRNNKLIRADEVHIGDTLYNDYIVYDIAHNVASKASTPITMSGRIQVNGVKSSCYIAGAREAEIEHQILAPFRWTSQHLSEHYAALVVENCIHDVIQIYVLLIKR